MRILTPAEIQMVRKRLGMSQVTFARTFHLSLATVRSWEDGIRTPSGAAAVLLWLLDSIPEEVLRAIQRP